MGRSTWLEGDDPTDWTLSYETGLQEIDAFYDIEQQHEDPPFGAETAGEDEFSTLMEDIEQLTAAGPHDATNITSSQDTHSLPNSGDQNDARLPNPRSDVATEVVNTQQLGSSGAGHEETAPLPLPAPVNSPSPNLQQDYTALFDASQSLQDLTSTGLPEHSEPLQFDGFSDLPETQRSKSGSLPTREPEMTPPKRDDELPSSSEGKSSLMDEMRGEEERYSGRQDVVKEVSQEQSQIQLPGIAIEDADNFELAVADARKAGDVNPRKSSVSLGMRLRSAAVPQKKTAKLALEDDSQPGANNRPSLEEPAKKDHVMTDVKHQNADEEMFRDVIFGGTNTELSVQKGRKKSRQNAEEDATHIDEGDVPSNVANKSKPAAQQPEQHLPVPKVRSEGVANRRPPRNSLGLKEMRRLTESKLLADSTPQRAMSATRQTRAQKEEEAKKAPNAGRAAKERHRGKGHVQ